MFGDVAVASAPASRQRPPETSAAQPPTGFFPMSPSPKCDVLDNFGDPRSGGRHHEGVDILATEGQAVYAVAPGTLTSQSVAGTTAGGAALAGNGWVLTTSDRTYYFYAHLSRFAAGLGVGSSVASGQLIGYVGDTGNPGIGNFHLHFEMHPQGGAAVNSLPLLNLPAACRVY
jgi:peptidoglycan LD-endopeptidase LytH